MPLPLDDLPPTLQRAEFSGALRFVLAAILALITITIVRRIIERIRWQRAGDRGFDAFLSAGAPLRHERLVAAFDDPDAFTHRGDRGRVFSLGTVTLPTGRLVLEGVGRLPHEIEAFDVELPAGRPLEVEGFALGDDPTFGFAALRIRVADGEPHTLEPAFTTTWREERAEKERLLPHLRVESDEDVLLGAYEAIEELAQALEADGDAFDEILLKAPKGFRKQKGASPLTKVAELGDERHAVVVARSYLMEEKAHAYLQRDEQGNVLTVLVDFGALGAPEWNWTHFR